MRVFSKRLSGLPLGAASLVMGLGALVWTYTVDDAFVLARYATRLLAGQGYTMNEGPPTDGVTGPLALVPALVGAQVVGDPVLGTKLAGLLASALAVAIAVALARDRTHGLVTLGVAVMGSTPLVWSVGGLETGLGTLALTTAWAGAKAVGDGSLHAGSVVGLAVAALAWLRPELAPASLVLLLAVPRWSPRSGAWAWSWAALGAASVVAFRVALFGSALPLSAAAKPPDLGHGLGYVGRALVVQLGLGGPLVAWLAAREGDRFERLAALVVMVHLAAIALAGGDWMPGFRLLAPVLPLYAWLVAGPIARRWSAKRARLAALLATACLALPAVDLALQLGPIRRAAEARETTGVELATWLGSHAERVALVDVGFLALRSGVEVVDLGGITDPRIGRLPGGHLDKRVDPAQLRARDPDVIVLHSSAPPRVDAEGRLVALWGYPVEQRVARMAWVQTEMRVERVVPYTPSYYYVVLARRRASPPRSPGAGEGGTLEP